MDINVESILEKIDMGTIDLTDFNEGSMAFLTAITIGSEETIRKCISTLRGRIVEVHPDILWVSVLLLLGRKDLSERSRCLSLFEALDWEKPPYKDLTPLWGIFMDTYIPNSL